MSEPSDGSAESDQQALREEAAAWFARMRRDDAERFRVEHERWLAADERHQPAYRRIGATFERAKVLHVGSNAKISTAGSGNATFKRILVAAVALAAAAALGLIIAENADQPIATEAGRSTPPAVEFASGPRVGRQVRLADGSGVSLANASTVTVAFDARMRNIRLELGSARFAVAHETRPFTVFAGGGRIVAHGTIFDVKLDRRGGVDVALIEGSIDVQTPEASGSTIRHRQLGAGQRLSFPVTTAKMLDAHGNGANTTQEDLLVDFDRAPLSDVIARANRSGGTRITLADASLDLVQVSGDFRVDDPAALASHLAALLDLNVARGATGEIVLARP